MALPPIVPEPTLPEFTSAAEGTLKFRSQMGHISRHSAVFFAGSMFTAAAGYVFKVYVARVLGAETLGLYALGMTIVGLFNIFGGLGLAQSAVRFISSYLATKDYEALRSLVWKSSAILIVVNCLLGVVILAVGPWVANTLYRAPKLVPYLSFFVVIMLLGTLTNFWSQVLVGYRDVSSRSIINNFVGSTLIIIITLAMFAFGVRSLRGYLWAQVLNPIVILLLLWLVVRRHTPLEARAKSLHFAPFPRALVHFSAAVFGIDVLKFVLSQSDKVLIGLFLNPAEVGVYSVAAAIVVYVALILQSVNQIFAPTISDLYARGEKQLLARLFQTLTKWIVGFTLPLAASIIVFAGPIMAMFGPGFEKGWPILVLGSLGQLVSCGVGSVGLLLLMSGNQKLLVKVQIRMAIVMLTLNIVLIPRLGVLGAAIAAAITNAGTNLWNLWEVRSALGLSPYNRTYARLLIPIAAMVITLCAIRWSSASVHPYWIVIVGSTLLAFVIFIGATFLSGLNEDDRLIVSAIRGKLRANLTGQEN